MLLLILCAVSVLGILSIYAGLVELEIARDEREIRESFFNAESTAVEGAQRLLNSEPVNLVEVFESWHHSRKQLEESGIDFRKPGHWDIDGLEKDNAVPGSISPETYLAAVEWAVATGESLIITEPRVYVNRIYGLCRKYNAENLVEIGVKLRY